MGMVPQSENVKETKSDPMETAIALIEKEQKEFNNHWIWQKLRCSPEDFFKAFRQHVQTMNIPKAQWDRAMQKLKDEIHIKTREKRAHSAPVFLPSFSSLRA